MTSHLPQRVRRLPGALLQRSQRHLRIARQKLAQGTAKDASKDDRGDDIDAQAQVGRVSEDVVELGCKTALRQQPK